ncbi:hypothetical protein CBQ26_13835 [Deinococcus indicus]|uniref:Macro domain-containing protein n=1 Tax=Deinococcus indicus TaxID=223556 RepID=A0A246BIS7_9DEIO|nr:macro domain-containing protein [Deinococcus indicus]OWL95127.1 hypothetical protein CBQ26_13835 [Deinococcus indicus]
MINSGKGNLLQADVEALVNTVNTVGVMGKGIALQFKRAFPKNYKDYVAAAKAGEVRIGRMFVSEQPLHRPHYVINFPTKQHWRAPSEIRFIEEGLEDLVRVIRAHNIRSIAIPPLGCGNGGLDWAEVKPLVEQAFANLPDVEVLLFAPGDVPDPQAMPMAPRFARMTPSKALMVQLIDRYLQPGYTLGRVESQKLAYFLQAAGAEMRLGFTKAQFGPYAHNLSKLLDDMEGVYTDGHGDGSGRARMRLRDGALEASQTQLAQDQTAQQQLQEVSRLIVGFETSYALELLASVHWVAVEQGAETSEHALKLIQAWTPRKAQMMQPHHVRVAWQRLEDQGWLQRRAVLPPKATPSAAE